MWQFIVFLLLNYIVHRHLDDLRACPLNVDAVKILLQWTIDENGKILQSSAKSAEPQKPTSDSLNQCFVDKLNAWTFPPLAEHKSLTVTYPFALKRETDTGP